MTHPLDNKANDTAPPDAHDRPNESLQQELAHRFRHTLHGGHVSPLLHLVLRHKQEAHPCKETA
jgi:hypothetical protein